jgi:SAM-dependent methyltransferase
MTAPATDQQRNPMEDVPCNLCGSARLRKSLQGPDVRYGTPGTFTVVRCVDCGLCFVSPRPTLDQIGAHYPPSYSEHTPSAEGNPFARAQAEMVGSLYPGGGSVLDVGCASGAFLTAMRSKGWTVAGIDTSEQAHSLARSLPGAEIKLGVLGPDDFAPASFDAVTLWSVLEHLHDPLATLRTVRRLLKPEGRLFLVLPNYRAFERMLFRTRWFALELPRHLYHFSPKPLAAMLERAGFKVDKLQHASGHDTLRFSLRLVARRPIPDGQGPQDHATEGQCGPHGRSGAQTSGALQRVNGAVVDGFTKIADRVGFGSQLLVVARPS